METLGEWLRRTREAKGTTIEEAEIGTRIRPRFLEALEAGDFAIFPGGEVQVRGFLRIYARYLSLSPDQVLARYDREVRGIEAAPSGGPAEMHSVSSGPSPPRSASSRPRSASTSTYQPRRTNLLTLTIVSIASIALIATAAVALSSPETTANRHQTRPRQLWPERLDHHPPLHRRALFLLSPLLSRSTPRGE